MTVEHYPDFFNDVFGPIMQPGSSSHTAAPCRLGFLARNLLGEPLQRLHVLLDRNGSFAGTFGMMAEDKAMLAGAMGILPHDVRIFNAQQIAERNGIDYSFEFTDMRESTHINAMKFVLTGKSGKVVTLVGDSTGGGMIETKVVNGYPLRVKGDTFVLLLFDPHQAVTPAQIEQVQAHLPAVVGSGSSTVDGNETLYCFKTADRPDPGAIEGILPDGRISLLEPVLPVITRPARKPQLFDTMARWREIAQERRLPLWEVAVQYQVDASAWTRQAVIDYMRMVERKMQRQTRAAYEADTTVPESPFKPNFAAEWDKHMRSPRRLTDDVTALAIKGAYGAGSGIPGVEVVAGPMGSGGGYVSMCEPTAVLRILSWR